MRTANSFLIITRDLEAQDAYVQRLRAERLPAHGVSTREEAMRLAGLAPLSAVLFDVEYSGDWQSLVRLRQELPSVVPIVVLSRWIARDRTYRNLARDLGCAGFVAKPAAAALVVRSLQRAAAGSPWSEYIASATD